MFVQLSGPDDRHSPTKGETSSIKGTHASKSMTSIYGDVKSESSNGTTHSGEGASVAIQNIPEPEMELKREATLEQKCAQISESNINESQEATFTPHTVSQKESKLKRQETYVVSKQPSTVRSQRPPKLLKRSSLSVTLNTPPTSPRNRDKHSPDFTLPNTEESKDHLHPETNNNKELVTNLNDLLDDPSTRMFPRSGFDRNIMYSPFSMPFISVRAKKRENRPVSESEDHLEELHPTDVDNDETHTTR